MMGTRDRPTNAGTRLETYNRICDQLEVRANGSRLDEWEMARFFWHGVLGDIEWDSASSASVLLAEEALVLRMIGARLLRQVRSNEFLVERKTGPDVLCPRLDSWMKIQERFRKIMKELLEPYGYRDGDRMPESLASMMLPKLKKGEGVLNELFGTEGGAESVGDTGEERAGD